MEFLIMVDIFSKFLLKVENLKTKSINQLDVFANIVIYFCNKLP